MIYQKKSYRVVIFDVDGTLTTTKSGATFRKSADDWQWLPGRLERLKEVNREGGTHIGIATNQGGVAFGYLRSYDIMKEIGEMCEQVPISPKGVRFCFTHPKGTEELYREENDERRKPGPEMLREIMGEFMMPVNPAKVLMVGDRPEDEGAALAAGCAFAWADDFFAPDINTPNATPFSDGPDDEGWDTPPPGPIFG